MTIETTTSALIERRCVKCNGLIAPLTPSSGGGWTHLGNPPKRCVVAAVSVKS